MVRALSSGSRTLGSSLGQVLCYWQDTTLTVPLSTQVYKWAPAKSMLEVTTSQPHERLYTCINYITVVNLPVIIVNLMLTAQVSVLLPQWKDIYIYSGSQVVNIGHKHVLFAFINELLKKTRIIEWAVNVAMARWVETKKENKRYIEKPMSWLKTTYAWQQST